MNANGRELVSKDEVYVILGAAMAVSRELGSGVVTCCGNGRSRLFLNLFALIK